MIVFFLACVCVCGLKTKQTIIGFFSTLDPTFTDAHGRKRQHGKIYNQEGKNRKYNSDDNVIQVQVRCVASE